MYLQSSYFEILHIIDVSYRTPYLQSSCEKFGQVLISHDCQNNTLHGLHMNLANGEDRLLEDNNFFQ